MQRKLKRTAFIDDYKNAKSFKEVEKIVTDRKLMLGLRQNTLKGYVKVYNALSEYFGDEVDAFKLTHKDATDFVRYLQNEKIHYRDKIHKTGTQRGLKASTINSYIKLCKSIYQELVDLDYIEENPFRYIKCMKRSNERIKTIPSADVKKLLESLDNQYFTDFRMYVIVHVLLDTFGRISEVLNVKKEDIDFDNRNIFLTDTKNGESRYVTFSVKTKKLLLEFIDETASFNSDYVFVGIDGGKLNDETFRASLKKYCKNFDIKTNITPHMFRHTAAMLFIENGGNMRVLQKILGHKRIATTEIYAHVTEDLIALQQEDYSPLEQIIKGDKKYVRSRSKRMR